MDCEARKSLAVQINVLIAKENGVDNVESTLARFYREQATERREILMPFLWKICTSEQGWIAGNIEKDSVVAVTNGLYFSIPAITRFFRISRSSGQQQRQETQRKYHRSRMAHSAACLQKFGCRLWFMGRFSFHYQRQTQWHRSERRLDALKSWQPRTSRSPELRRQEYFS
jgi:hypothetical protein